jgi:hypothetical protein
MSLSNKTYIPGQMCDPTPLKFDHLHKLPNVCHHEKILHVESLKYALRKLLDLQEINIKSNRPMKHYQNKYN